LKEDYKNNYKNCILAKLTNKINIMKILNYFFIAIFVACLVSCQNNDIQSSNLQMTSGKVDELTKHITLPDDLNKKMRKSLMLNIFNELKKINANSKISFSVSKENYFKMIDGIPEDAEYVVFHFVQYNSKKLSNKYKDLKNNDGQLYIIYSYNNKHGEVLNDKYYAFLDTPNIISFSKTEYNTMVKDYIYNIKSKIDKYTKDPSGNTMYIKVLKSELVALKIKALQYDELKEFRFALAEFQSKQIFNKYKNNNRINNKISKFSNFSEGHLTFITDAINSNGNVINEISASDLNTFCPNDCP